MENNIDQEYQKLLEMDKIKAKDYQSKKEAVETYTRKKLIREQMDVLVKDLELATKTDIIYSDADLVVIQNGIDLVKNLYKEVL